MAIGDGVIWNEALPDDNTVANQIDDYNRDLRVGVRARMDTEHVWPTAQTGTDEAGHHRYITLQVQTAAPTLIASSGQAGALFLKSSGLDIFLVNSAGATWGLPIVAGTLGSIPICSSANAQGLVVLAGSTDGFVLKSHSTTGAPTWLPENIVQIVSTGVSSVSTGTTIIPTDNSIPQISEGDLRMTLNITPKSATNILHVEAVVIGAVSINADLVAAAFIGTTADAFAAVTDLGTAGNCIQNMKLDGSVIASTTGETAITIRVGPASAATATFNGVSGTGKLGATPAVSHLRITEVSG